MDHERVIEAEAARFAEVIAAADPDAPVPTCPDWTVADLAWHLASVHWFWSQVLARALVSEDEQAALEASAPTRPPTVEGSLRTLAGATQMLVEQLRSLPDDAPRWTWWDPDQSVGFTRRMQTCEATMHRVDAELAAKVPVSPIAPDAACAAIDHCVDVMWGWLPAGVTYEPLATVTLRATDTGQDWLVEVGHWFGTDADTGVGFDRPLGRRARTDVSAALPTAEACASAQDLALWAWTRGTDVTPTGDPQACASLRALIEAGIG